MEVLKELGFQSRRHPGNAALAAEVHIPAQEGSLKDSLTRSQEIEITVTGRESGRAISNPIWFASDNDKLYLLPVKGSDTQWYKIVLKNPSIRIKASSAESELHAVPITDPAQVKSVVEKFRQKYGADEVKKYYVRLDVAVVAPLH